MQIQFLGAADVEAVLHEQVGLREYRRPAVAHRHELVVPADLVHVHDRLAEPLRLRAEQRFRAAQDPACRLDQRDYLLSLIDSASTLDDGAGQCPGFDAQRMRNVITEAATKSHWGKPSGVRRAQGIAAHYDAQTCMAAAIDVELTDEGRLIVHDTVFVADLGAVENPGRLRAQLEANK